MDEESDEMELRSMDEESDEMELRSMDEESDDENESAVEKRGIPHWCKQGNHWTNYACHVVCTKGNWGQRQSCKRACKNRCW